MVGWFTKKLIQVKTGFFAHELKIILGANIHLFSFFFFCLEELAGLLETGEKLKQQQQESTRRENVLVMRLATKEQEMQDLLVRRTENKDSFIMYCTTTSCLLCK